MTNYDRIKSMSVEEFANFVLYESHNIYSQYTNSLTGFQQWLLQEVSENDI